MIGKECDSLIILLAKIKLKANFGRLNINDKVIVQVGLTVPDPTMIQVEPLATVTRESVLCG